MSLKTLQAFLSEIEHKRRCGFLPSAPLLLDVIISDIDLLVNEKNNSIYEE
ncbi:MAG: hypothetical protein PWP07_835 [Epulopiscium sp.]|jgi:hypothetical protein|nr:hypothetical protein [Defluviitaleaceae bacterium]MDK2787610.1 hypothetical protein [Candidatus Epulonipiscium sp.]HHW66477.1 hypothetical protein [Candidatus Epulonipiscium sp.]